MRCSNCGHISKWRSSAYDNEVEIISLDDFKEEPADNEYYIYRQCGTHIERLPKEAYNSRNGKWRLPREKAKI